MDAGPESTLTIAPATAPSASGTRGDRRDRRGQRVAAGRRGHAGGDGGDERLRHHAHRHVAEVDEPGIERRGVAAARVVDLLGQRLDRVEAGDEHRQAGERR